MSYTSCISVFGESRGFVIAGGAALVAVGLSERPTDQSSIQQAGNAFVEAALGAGWAVEHVHEAEAVLRVMVHLDSGTYNNRTRARTAPTCPSMKMTTRCRSGTS